MDYLDLRDLAEEMADLIEREDEPAIALDDEEKDRLVALRALEDQLFTTIEEYSSNESTLIPDIEFEDYAQEFAFDVGYVPREDNNPVHFFIDWDGWAESLKTDYTEVEFDDVTYLIRTY